MTQIAFLLLCHRDPQAVIRQATRLSEAGDVVAIHFDRSAPRADYRVLEQAFRDAPGVILVKRRIRCGWGQWSLVRATLATCRTALKTFPEASHFYMVSGDCMPIKPATYTHARLEGGDRDYIESHDFLDSNWIKTGMREERLIYRHVVNERRHKWWFYKLLEWQKQLGLKRKIPKGLRIMIGSQWWCLRRSTLEQILAFCRKRRDILWFFRTTWIPDETFFQTLVRHLIPRDQIENRSLTFLLFTDYGMPATFHNDHFDLLLAQDAVFARKISPEAEVLRDRLGAVWVAPSQEVAITGEGHALHRFLTGQGRQGARFGPRIWQAGAQMRREERLVLVACKKWHVAKRLVDAIRRADMMPAYDYLFSEIGTSLPDLGGIESSLDKRNRHRRAFIQLLYEDQSTDRMLICVDPSDVGLIEDLSHDRGDVRVLDIACDLDDAWLRGHAERIGLVGAATPPEALTQILANVRHAIAREQVRLDEADLGMLAKVTPGMAPDMARRALAQVLEISEEEGAALLEEARLFED